MSFVAARECRWMVDGLTLEGLQWGDPDGRPVLALHGWLDNAASFSRLAPQLSGCHVVALDLSGQGLSSRRSADATYQIWDDLPQLVAILDALGWEQAALLGHSRGAIISTLLASAIPQRITHLILLDALIPLAVPEEAFAAQLGRFLCERQSAVAAVPRRYADYESAIAARTRRGLPDAAARLLAGRSLEGSNDVGWSWRSDLRLRGASAVKLSAAQIGSVLAAIDAPVLLMLAAGGMMQGHDQVQLAMTQIKRMQTAQVEGSHHFHMEPVIDDWIASIMAFLEEY